MKWLSRADLARRIEHTCLDPAATRRDIEKLCAETREQGFFGVCVMGSRVELARALLEETDFKIIAFVGFPLGTEDLDVKRYETEVAVDAGAHEIEAVINIGKLKDGDHKYVLRELRDIVEAADERPVRAVLELSLLTDAELHALSELVPESGVQAVSTGSGMGSSVDIGQVRTLRGLLGEKFLIKSAGGIENATTALALVEAGAFRLGTKAGIAILDGLSPTPPLL